MKKVKVNKFVSKIMYSTRLVGLLVGERDYNFIRISVLPIISIKENKDSSLNHNIVIPEKITIGMYSGSTLNNIALENAINHYHNNCKVSHSKCADVSIVSINIFQTTIHIKSIMDYYDESEISVMIPAFTSGGNINRTITCNYSKYDKQMYVYYGDELAYTIPIDGLEVFNTDIELL